ncbi:flagellar hook protein FlgE [Halomonas sp. 328]|uniref:flagellar hook protein FlgE n=1 Tax=Halomonas sp. 328 TaxID=2776704 RepID=UPI0018A7ACA7|nr:flagellar hook protein FlgE [Halomonas sp. 328]MBF8222251.1 flagellar hook protein FlgE [Halomonas sp. 328]
MSFSQALSGLNSAASKLGVVGNNIANSQTVGFKGSGVQFADVYAGSVGLGTRVSAVLQNFSEGNLETTNRNLDLAIAGQGFYRFQQPSGEVIYSRNGQLSMNADGDLVNAQGAKIMGYGLEDANDPFSAVAAGGEPVAINVPSDDMPAQATENLNLKLNLDAGEPVIAAAFDADDSTTYNYSTSASVFDSQGNARNLTLFYTKTGANTWEVNARLSGGPAGAGEHFDSIGDLTFDANGVLNGYTSENLTFPLAGEGFADLTFDFDMTGTTQFANTSTVNDLTQDGYTSGTLVGITIESNGTVMRNYSNEKSLAAGQIVLASFRNPEGLKPEGDNGWVATEASGAELRGVPGTGLLGTVESGAIETSNVDMARELVEMIVTQRAYQANSQTIKTQDEVLQTAINLR